MYYLSIDVGTSGGKVNLFNKSIELIATYREDYPTLVDAELGCSEHDPEDWWQVTKRGIRSVLDKAGIDAGRIAGIGLSCMTPVLLALDASGAPITRAWLWNDRRAANLLPELLEQFAPDEPQRICGSACKPISFLTKLYYFKKKDPRAYERTAAFVQANGYMVYRMTGKLSLDVSHSGLMHLFDKNTGEFSERMFAALDLDPAKFPTIVKPDEIVGRVTEECSRELGLCAGTPIVSGGHDSALSAYAFGLDQLGNACLDVGNAANLVMAADCAVPCKAADVYTYPVDGKWLFQIYTATCGSAFRWYKNTFGQAETERAQKTGVSEYDLLCREASRSPIGANGVCFLPYLQGAQQNSRVSASFSGINIQNGRPDFVRAVLEGCAMSVAFNRSQMEEASGIHIRELTLCGGGSKNDFWVQIFADVLNLPVRVDAIAEAAGSGAAMLAAKAVNGRYVPRVANVRELAPIAANVAAYKPVYQRFKSLLEAQIENA